MRKHIFLIASALLFASLMGCLVRELWEIVKYPEKHNETPGWHRYRNSFWFEHPSAYRSKLTSKHYWANILTIPLFLLGWYILWAGGLRLQTVLFIPEGVHPLKTAGVEVGVLMGIFWLIGLESWLPYHCSHPIAVALSLHMFAGSQHTKKLKASILMVITTALFIPAMSLAVANYAYATEEGFVISRYFSVSETSTAYTDCSAQTEWRFNRSGSECYFSYNVTLPDGTTFDLFEACGENGTEWLHERLTEAGVTLQRGSIDAKSWAMMQTIETETRLAWLSMFFAVETP